MVTTPAADVNLPGRMLAAGDWGLGAGTFSRRRHGGGREKIDLP